MKDKEIEEGFPREFAIYLPFFSEEEKAQLEELGKEYYPKDSLKNFADFLMEFINSQSDPSIFLLFALGKILYDISDYKMIDELDVKYPSLGIILWKIRVLLEKGYNEEAIKFATQIKENKDVSPILRLHALRSIANGYLNLGNYEQSRIYLSMLFDESMITQKLPQEEKPVVNDILLDGHRDNFFVNRYVEEKIKLENKLNVALHIALELEDRNQIGTFYYLLALLQRDSGNLDESIALTFKAIDYFGETGNHVMLSAANGNIGHINVILGKLEDAEIIFKEIKEIFQKAEANKYLSLTIRSLGDIAIKQGDYQKAIEKYEEALKIVEKLNLKETYQYCTLAELYLRSGRDKDFNVLMDLIDEEIRTNPSPMIESYVFLLKGMYHVRKLNYGEAEGMYLKALEIADRGSKGELSAKILMNLILLYLGKFDLEKKKEILDLTLRNIEQLIPYFSENKLFNEQVAMLMLKGKILAIKEDYTSSFNSLQKAKDLVDGKKNKKMYQLIEKRIDEINLLFTLPRESLIEWVNEPFRKEISSLEEIGLRYIQQPYVELEVLPLALIILHRSGIPLRSYVILKRAVKDQLLFGGFIVAVKDMLSELFEEQKSQMLVITYGNHKIIIEAHPKGFSSVAVSALDSFSLRRKIHQLTEKLADIDIPKQFVGELDNEISSSIDQEVQLLFGTNLVYSETIKVDF